MSDARRWHWTTVLVALWLPLAAIGGLWASAFAAPGDQPGVAPVRFGPKSLGTAVYPHQELPLRFNHGEHLALGVGCETCHVDIATSTRVRDDNFPTGSACDSCHGPQHAPDLAAPDRKCEMCHAGMKDGQVVAAVKTPPAKLHFNHKMHLSRGASCETCHGDMSKVRLATTLQLPREADCVACHDGLQAPDTCGTCHPTGPGGRLVTRRDDKPNTPPLVPSARSSWGASHTLEFVRDHTAQAKANPALCENCHHPDDCQTCHNGAVRPMRIHAADYINAHALDAKGRTSDCQSCHRYQNDCRACHQRLGLGQGTADDRFAVGSPLGFHPEGWAGAPGAPQGHAMPAQRNIGACASCHDEDTCLACHATTSTGRPGLGVSPHGPRFVSSPRCTQLARANRRVCLKCHVPADPALNCAG